MPHISLSVIKYKWRSLMVEDAAALAETLGQTQNALAQAQNALAQTQNALAQTQNALAQSENALAQSQLLNQAQGNELAQTQQQLQQVQAQAQLQAQTLAQLQDQIQAQAQEIQAQQMILNGGGPGLNQIVAGVIVQSAPMLAQLIIDALPVGGQQGNAVNLPIGFTTYWFNRGVTNQPGPLLEVILAAGLNEAAFDVAVARYNDGQGFGGV